MKIKALKDKWMPDELLIFSEPQYCIILIRQKEVSASNKGWTKEANDMDTNSNSEADGTGEGEKRVKSGRDGWSNHHTEQIG